MQKRGYAEEVVKAQVDALCFVGLSFAPAPQEHGFEGSPTEVAAIDAPPEGTAEEDKDSEDPEDGIVDLPAGYFIAISRRAGVRRLGGALPA